MDFMHFIKYAEEDYIFILSAVLTLLISMVVARIYVLNDVGDDSKRSYENSHGTFFGLVCLWLCYLLLMVIILLFAIRRAFLEEFPVSLFCLFFGAAVALVFLYLLNRLVHTYSDRRRGCSGVSDYDYLYSSLRTSYEVNSIPMCSILRFRWFSPFGVKFQAFYGWVIIDTFHGEEIVVFDKDWEDTMQELLEFFDMENDFSYYDWMVPIHKKVARISEGDVSPDSDGNSDSWANLLP